MQDHLKGGEIKAIEKEKEGGVEPYEIETVLNGQARDLNVDTKGTLGLIESVQVPGKPMTFEAAYTDKSGKKHSIAVNADGSDTK